MSRWSSVSDKNREAVARNAQRILDDTDYDRLRTRTALAWLVAADVGATVVIALTWWLWGAIAGIGATLLWGAVFILLRIAVRSQADLPDEVLDERMRRERDAVYVVAYRGAISVIFLGLNALFISVAFRDNATVTFDYNQVSAIYWTCLAVILAAPSVALALRQRQR